MKLYLNQHALERIEKNGTLIAPLSCCGHILEKDRRCFRCGDTLVVTLRGRRHQETGTYKWDIFMGSPSGISIAPLTCAYCNNLITTEDRQCQCGAYCYLDITNINGRPELHREVAMKPIQTPKGIEIVTEDASPDHTEYDPPVDFSKYDLTLGALYCPFESGFSYSNMTHLDQNARCTAWHDIQMSAVMVFTEEGIFVELRAHDIRTDKVVEVPVRHRRVKQVYCPRCEVPIMDRSLLCGNCEKYHIDVIQKPPVVKPRPDNIGTDTYIYIELAPRPAGDTQRPENALVMEGDNWTEPEQPPEEETQTPEKKELDDETIYNEYIRLKEEKGYGQRPVAKALGVEPWRVQQAVANMKKKIAEEEAQKERARQARLELENIYYQRPQPQKRPKPKRPKPPKSWF